jgi:HTH-type transcriptional regulator / antitoxin HigA
MSESIQNEYVPKVVTFPGITLAEALQERGMSQAELAQRAGRPKKTINEIIRGQAAITPETAIQLERVLSIPASFWNTRQQLYDESLARKDALHQLQAYLDWPKRFPISNMMRNGWIPVSRSPVEKVESLLRFFQIASPDEWEQIWGERKLGVAFRESRSFKADQYALQAWIRRGEIEASAIDCGPYERNAFETALHEIRKLACDLPVGFDKRLVSICATCGVAVSFVPLVPGVHAWGATRWLKADRAMIMLSLRGKFEDVFWFSFYHEAGHLLFHGKKEVFIEEDGSSKSTEIEADVFARDSLIRMSDWENFVAGKSPFLLENVQAFARHVGISAAVVVGRLQHEGRIARSHLNGLRRRIDFSAA